MPATATAAAPAAEESIPPKVEETLLRDEERTALTSASCLTIRGPRSDPAPGNRHRPTYFRDGADPSAAVSGRSHWKSL